MLKIGFIDYYLDEWHANNYPAWIREASNGEMEVAYCWAEMDAPNGGLTSQAWADQHGAVLCSTQEELIAKSDVLCVLAPDNPETHERLTRLALESGKITYVDKTFAPDTAAAQRMIALAEAHNTPMMTTSALRYATEYQQLSPDGLVFGTSTSGGAPEIYMIHQIEPIVMLFGTDALRVQNVGTAAHPLFVIEFSDGRRAAFTFSNAEGFRMTLHTADGGSSLVPITSDFFRNFIQKLVAFYRTGEVLVPHAETLAVAAIREACIQALCTPDTWIAVRR